MDAAVAERFKTYPLAAKNALLEVRQLIYQTAQKNGVSDLMETVKWGEPSYISKQGSTIRMDWKEEAPEQFCIYFSCQSKLIETFREVYGELFEFSGNRALIFQLGKPLPKEELSQCLAMAMRYKKIKHLPLLGFTG